MGSEVIPVYPSILHTTSISQTAMAGPAGGSLGGGDYRNAPPSRHWHTFSRHGLGSRCYLRPNGSVEVRGGRGSRACFLRGKGDPSQTRVAAALRCCRSNWHRVGGYAEHLGKLSQAWLFRLVLVVFVGVGR